MQVLRRQQAGVAQRHAAVLRMRRRILAMALSLPQLSELLGRRSLLLHGKLRIMTEAMGCMHMPALPWKPCNNMQREAQGGLGRKRGNVSMLGTD
jgi:hypothetical protein